MTKKIVGRFHVRLSVSVCTAAALIIIVFGIALCGKISVPAELFRISAAVCIPGYSRHELMEIFPITKQESENEDFEQKYNCFG